LTLLMCTSISDGAAAVVVTRADLRPRTAKPRVLVRASAAASGFAASNLPEPTTTTVCAQKAYEEAGIGPQDVSVAEVHDAMAPGELLYYEQLGFCQPGGAAELLRLAVVCRREVIPWGPPVSPRSPNWCGSCVAKRDPARSGGQSSRWRRTPVAGWKASRLHAMSTYWSGPAHGTE
jgi:hypothetical protein